MTFRIYFTHFLIFLLPLGIAWLLNRYRHKYIQQETLNYITAGLIFYAVIFGFVVPFANLVGHSLPL